MPWDRNFRGIVFFAEMAETIPGTHCTYPRRDGQAEWASVGWINTGIVDPPKVVTRERTIIGSVSYLNDTRCIVSNCIGYCCIGRYYVHHCRFINCWRGRITHDDQRAFKRPSPACRARTRACCFMVHDTGEGWRGGRRKKTVSRRGWYQVTKTAQYWSWPPSRRTPSTSRKW